VVVVVVVVGSHGKKAVYFNESRRARCYGRSVGEHLSFVFFDVIDELTTILPSSSPLISSSFSSSSFQQSLKEEMEEYKVSTSDIEKKIAELKNRYLYVSSHQICELCGTSVLSHQFYIFPCSHAFHSDCLSAHVLPHLNPGQRRAVNDLQEQLAAELAAEGGGGGMGGSSSGGVGGSSSGGGGSSKRKATQLEAIQSEIDGYLAAECPFCGDIMIRSIDKPLIGEEEEEEKELLEWELK